MTEEESRWYHRGYLTAIAETLEESDINCPIHGELKRALDVAGFHVIEDCRYLGLSKFVMSHLQEIFQDGRS